MKHTFKKITAALAAAVMCALPSVNALSANANANANTNARYTYRKVFFAPYQKNIDHVVFGLACRSTNTDPPVADKIASGTLIRGSGGGPGCHSAGGTFYPYNSNMTGLMVSEHVLCNSPSDYHEVSSFAYAYDANGNSINNAVYSLSTFLVGDIDRNGTVDGFDRFLIKKKIKDQGYVLDSYTPYSSTSIYYNGTYYTEMNIWLDINDDGKIDLADYHMLEDYVNWDIPRFEK